MSMADEQWQAWEPDVMLRRLRRMQELSGIRGEAPAPAPIKEVSQETLARDRREARLKSAGDLFPAAAAAAFQSVGRCPRIVGNEASEEMARAVETFVRSPDMYSLVMIAPAGRGKSFAATWAIAEWQQQAMWLPAFSCRVSSAWDALREEAMKASLLIVDDLNEEAGGEWGVREMAILMQGRHNKGAKTIVTTNLMPDEIGARYGERLISRWSEEPYSEIVITLGADLRRGGR